MRLSLKYLREGAQTGVIVAACRWIIHLCDCCCEILILPPYLLVCCRDASLPQGYPEFRTSGLSWRESDARVLVDVLYGPRILAIASESVKSLYFVSSKDGGCVFVVPEHISYSSADDKSSIVSGPSKRSVQMWDGEDVH